MAQDGRTSRALWWMAAGLAICTGMFALWLLLRLGGPRVTDAVDDLGEVVAPLLAATMCGLASWRYSPARRAWALLGASCASWAAGQVVWCYYDLLQRVQVPFPSLADAGYLTAVPLAVVGLLSFPGLARHTFSRLRQLLDAAMITGSLLFASWALVLGPTFREHHGSLLKQVLSVSYPASDVAMVSLAVIVAIGAEARNRACLWLVMAGVVGFAISDSGFAYFTTLNSYGIGNVLDTGWVCGYFLIALGAFRSMTLAPGDESERAPDRVTVASVLVPYALTSLAVAVALARLIERDRFGLFLPAEGLLLAVALSARQVLTLFDNVRLNSHLIIKVERGSEELQSREERFAALVEHSSDPITICGPDGTIRFQSPSVRRVLGWDPEATGGRSLLDVIHPDDRPQWSQLVDRLLPRPGTDLTAEWRVQHADGTWRSLQSVVTNLLDEPSIAGLVLNSRDVTDQKALEDQLRHQALYDGLTGLANRALFGEHVDRALRFCSRNATSLTVMLIDLRNFKAVNDLHGRARGDQLLSEVAERLQATVRDSDVIGRLGGDQFAVLLEGAAVSVDPSAPAERFFDAFSRPFGSGTAQIMVQARIGVAVSGTDSESHADLLHNADVAVTAAKETNAESYLIFTTAMREKLLDRRRTESELRRALERDELVLHYQPLVELATDDIKGVEALIRWSHPDKGLVAPGAFISVAESSGLIVTIGQWVLEQACRDLKIWTKSCDRALQMSVNVSARQLAHPGFEAMVTKTLADGKVDPVRVTLEITESLFIDDMSGAVDVLKRLRRLGVRVAIDDFGTGYSSLSSLRDMPVDTLKIDKSFIDDIAGSAGSARLAQTIIHLANDLGLGTVAEGAEALEQVEVLRGLGCQLVQGYYFSRPVPAPDLEQLLGTGVGASARVRG